MITIPIQLLMHYFHNYRDLRESRQRYDSVGIDIKRKDNQIRELQQRLESSEGCKSIFISTTFFIRNQLCPALVYYFLYNILW